MKNVAVSSSWGRWKVSCPSGYIAQWTPEEDQSGNNFDLSTITRFNLKEWEAHYPNLEIREYMEGRGESGFDILDLGYWYRIIGGLAYEPPEAAWREQCGHPAQQGKF